MAGNNNVTVAIPGQENWDVWWQWDEFGSFQLDIVGFLAILGEGAVLSNAQVSALSRLFCLPRLIPAPQALLRTVRPTTLPPMDAEVTAVYSGNVKMHVHHVASILLGGEMEPYTVRCVRVSRKPGLKTKPTFLDKLLRGVSSSQPNDGDTPLPLIKAKANGPQFWVTLIGFFLTIILLVVSIVFGDGMSILATISLSSLSTIAGICNKWTLKLPKAFSTPTDGDVVIRYPNGSYLVVKCDEIISRELYFAPEEIDYFIKSQVIYRMLSLTGTILLMLGIVFLANAKLQLQFAWAGAYVVINIAYWISAAMSPRRNWDLDSYVVTEEGVEGGPMNENFTYALWKVILLTKSTKWIENGAAMPRSDTWREWAKEAEEVARSDKYSKSETLEAHQVKHDTRIFPRDVIHKGPMTIWKGPTSEQWDPKVAWSRISEKEQKQKPPPTEPPSAVHNRNTNNGQTLDDSNIV